MDAQVDRRVRELMATAERLSAGGRVAEAQQILQQIETEAPEHPVSLNEAAQRRLFAGDPAGARDILESAVRVDPSLPMLWVNLAVSLQRLKLTDEERVALDKALALDPRNLRALLQSGALYESRGEPRTAAAIYRRALESVPRGVALATDLQISLQRAQTVVNSNTLALEAFVEDKVQDLRARHSGQPLRRFDKSMAAVLLKQAHYRPRPTFMYFPGLPAIEFFDRDQFPWLDKIEAATDDIRSEFLKVMAEDAGKLEPYVVGKTQHDIFWELNESRRWSVYYLWRSGVECPEDLIRCPKTAEALSVWPKCELWGTGPSAVFSILDAKTRIPPHTGVNNARLIVHLPLIVPPSCWFRVGGEKREWEPGKAFVFDDTFEHEAWNGSDAPRSVLIFDIWNPYLSEAEREMVTALTAGVGEFYGSLPFYV